MVVEWEEEDEEWVDVDEFFIRFEASDTIENVKAKIEDQEGIPVGWQCLQHWGLELQNAETLRDLGVVADEQGCFYLVIKEEEEETDEAEETDVEEEEERGQ